MHSLVAWKWKPRASLHIGWKVPTWAVVQVYSSSTVVFEKCASLPLSPFCPCECRLVATDPMHVWCHKRVMHSQSAQVLVVGLACSLASNTTRLREQESHFSSKTTAIATKAMNLLSRKSCVHLTEDAVTSKPNYVLSPQQETHINSSVSCDSPLWKQVDPLG